MKVLLVDDEQELVSAMAERLSFRDIEADYATNSKDALRLAEDKSYDLAVLDVKMPKIGGLKLKKILQKKYPSMRFLFLTGHGSEQDFREGSAEAGGERFYLVKPVNIDVLIAKMKEVLA